MNETERIELLRAVAEVAPKEMGAEFATAQVYSEVECVLFMGCEQSPLYLHLDPEYADGDECFAMLDAMEKAGFYCTISNDTDPVVLGKPIPGKYCASVVEQSGFDLLLGDEPWVTGATRAEAIARAFVAVFQKQESPEP